MKKNDVFLIGNVPFVVVELMDTESNDEYAMILNLTNWKEIDIVKVETKDDGYKIKKVENEYLATKIRSNFNEKIKATLLNDYKIEVVDDEK